MYLHNTTFGKAILAHLPRRAAAEIIDQYGLPATTERTVANRDALFDESKEIRTTDVSFDDGERLDGLRCVAVPIIDASHDVDGAISLSGPTSRFQSEYYWSEIPTKLTDAASAIELNTRPGRS